MKTKVLFYRPASTGPLWVPSDDDEEEDVLPALRCTRSKTLPSALRRSRSKQSVKRVRFADSLGLDLENLQYFVKEDLHLQKFNIHFSTPSSSTPPPQLPHFPKQLINQPAPRLVLHNFPYRSEQEYQVKTRDSRVCVAALRASGSSIVGQVNLLNVAFDKVVVVRYTIDGWATQDEIVASYSHRLFDTEDIDAFNFTIAIPVKLSEGKCEFCVQYQVAGAEFWDNNGGDNYIVNVSTKGPSSPFTRCYGASTGLPDAPRGSTRRQQQRRWGRALEESDEETPYVSSAPRRGAHFH
ncbi:Protein phosphatase 1 regulatory subunit [Caenorhabditis elegans]|uniref:Protein phosphatase 1 regulatory subunit n=1 Tax=Caenorhabditis elegans TaxID=6239 RepID=H2KZH6_CAEEL|nr:Protein phosphatase 1 regulatory subunit [Caenorhabditis elegans]CCD68223.1 Protein phosphatase 1 regulatory subunit [Caenorhabditis elegans]|eukprot:NP_500392.1 Protein phosphatase 1 regulatory subunit [Caenorhabditis elegans]